MSINLLKSKNILPSEYQQVEYIQSTGEQYIDTGVIGSDKINCSADFMLLELTSNNNVLSSGKSGGEIARGYLISTSGTNYFRLGYGSQLVSSNVLAEINTKYHWETEISTSTQRVILNNSEILSIISSQTFTVGYSLYIFANNQNGAMGNSSIARLYSLQLTDNSVLIRNFIPCYRKFDSKPGLYDTINSVFYTNANTSATTDFITGSEVGFDVQEVEPYILKRQLNVPTEYQEVEYLESTGEQWINTNHIPTISFKITTDFESLKQVGDRFQAICGCQYYDEQGRALARVSMLIISNNSAVRLVTFPDGFSDADIVLPDDTWINNKRTYYLDLQGIAKVDNLQALANPTSHSSYSPLYILARNDNKVTDDFHGAVGRLYYAEWEDGNNKCNFIPCYRKSDSKPGLYDTINSQFYTNANTSASQDFIVGNDVNKYTLQPVDINLLVRRPEVPIEYQQIEYIQSTGEQYIETNIIPNQDSTLEVDYQFLQFTQSAASIGGTRESSSLNGFGIGYRSSQMVLAQYGGSQTSNINMPKEDTQRHVEKLSKNQFYRDGILLETLPSSTFTGYATINLFRWNSALAGDAACVYTKVYGCKIYNGDTIVRNFIPCYRKLDNKPGFYNTVNNKFYTNANTSATQDFIVGPDVTVYPLNTIQQL